MNERSIDLQNNDLQTKFRFEVGWWAKKIIVLSTTRYWKENTKTKSPFLSNMKLFIFYYIKKKKLEKELCINLCGKRRNTKIFFLFSAMEINIKVKYLKLELII